MGKDIKGKELGKWIPQRKDNGLYYARFVDRFGKRKTIYSKDIRELKRLKADMEYENRNELNIKDNKITLDAWFEEWLNVYKNDIKKVHVLHMKVIMIFFKKRN